MLKNLKEVETTILHKNLITLTSILKLLHLGVFQGSAYKDLETGIIYVNTLRDKIMDEFIRVISFEGKIIISDFTNEGFEMIDKIHAVDGRKHEKANITLNDIKEYFRSKKFKVNQYKSKFQETLTVYK